MKARKRVSGVASQGDEEAAKVTRARKSGPGKVEDPGSSNVFEEAVGNHVESFNNFVEYGIHRIRESIPPALIEKDDNIEDSITIEIKDLKLSKPDSLYQNYGAGGAADWNPLSDVKSRNLPSHCRLGHITYAGLLQGEFVVSFGKSPHKLTIDANLGQIPIMVRSKACNLDGMSKDQLVKCKEDETEVGGYFILNGLERVIRMLLMPRANYPMAIIRGSYKSRGPLYTGYATLMRCMRLDGSTQTNSLHYCRDGSVFLRFSHSKEEWLIPFVLAAKCMYDVADGVLLELLAGSGGGSVYMQERAFVLLQQQNDKQPIGSQRHARKLLGNTFRLVLGGLAPRHWSDERVGEMIAQKFFFVHTDDPWEKLQTMVIMYQKLIALVRNEIEADNQDAFSSHELLLPGQLYGMVCKESLEVLMQKIRGLTMKLLRKNDKGHAKHSLQEFKDDSKHFKKIIESCADIGRRMENFLATGNVSSRSGMDLMQASGYTIVADKLNTARFSSHFVAVHRGQYFMEMKTTTVRKLLPETWGFLCPVHTPDGAPCGLLNHLAHACKGVWRRYAPEIGNQLIEQLASLGVEVFGGGGHQQGASTQRAALNLTPTYAAGAGVNRGWVCLDGRPVGHVSYELMATVADSVRALKVAKKVPHDLEIVCIEKSWKHLFPGLYLFLCPSRLVRPVRCLRTGKIEWIGPMEQLFLNVAALGKERRHSALALADGRSGNDANELPEYLPVAYTHEEIRPTELFSVLAALTPFSNHNQSPRNMYQCQMLKQTMGTPYHNHAYRTDNKIYRIWCPQKPLVRTVMYENSDCDAHPQGTNAVIAVITYTGYDMEDAMIINRGSYQRGFKQGMVYKTKIIEAGSSKLPAKEQHACKFTCIKVNEDGKKERVSKETFADGSFKLDDDGLPRIGAKVEQGDALYCYIDHQNKPHIERYKDEEPAYIESVTRIDGTCKPNGSSRSESEKVSLRLRLTRNPTVGDKFSSRHGQKGVMSILWPSEDMPFSESGITPDILFNPHGFPSRMTIGMLIESIAAKSAACAGRPTANASTFRDYRGYFDEEDENEADPFLAKTGDDELNASDAADTAAGKIAGPRAAEYFGKCLKKHGYQSMGTEKMYSGIHGTEIETEIFMGVVYYQRLRHMVAEKAQVRARGPVDKKTMQPVKGRKRHGGIRFGEMERDSLLAHGTSFLLHDRLCRSSDYDIGFVCPQCGSILTPQANAHERGDSDAKQRKRHAGDPWECPPCSKKAKQDIRCHPMPIPWVFRYLAAEMASMNVKMKIGLADRGRQASLSSVKLLGNAMRPAPGLEEDGDNDFPMSAAAGMKDDASDSDDE